MTPRHPAASERLSPAAGLDMLRGMRTLTVLGAVFILVGCTEVYSGPRLVHYNQDWFYIRHAPVSDGPGSVDKLAAEQCPDPGRPAQLMDAAQYYPFDLRDATYRCARPTPTPSTDTTPAAASAGQG